jgi:hypothetical protein
MRDAEDAEARTNTLITQIFICFTEFSEAIMSGNKDGGFIPSCAAAAIGGEGSGGGRSEDGERGGGGQAGAGRPDALAASPAGAEDADLGEGCWPATSDPSNPSGVRASLPRLRYHIRRRSELFSS